MATIRTVNMLWERKWRGSYPVAPFSLDDLGTLTAALPRPLETRAYDLTRLNLEGGAESRVVFSVETLLELDASAQADEMIGMTSDDLYLFQGGRKSRYLGEKHITFVDAALSADGQKLVAGFSDMAASSFALSYGGINGQVVWLREVEVPLSAVAISRDGGRIALGAESGQLRLLDTARRDVWAFDQTEPVRALACDSKGLSVAYGTAGGSVGLVDGFGTRQWEANLPGEVVALALSADGVVCTALCRPQPDTGTTLIYCLVGAGQVGWEYEAEKRLVSLSLSPNGRYLATSGRDGTHTVYEIVLSEGQASGAGGNDPQDEAAHLAQTGDLSGAYHVLRGALAAAPADFALFEDFLQIREQWIEAQMQQAQEHLGLRKFTEAVRSCETVLEAEPQHSAVTALREAVRQTWGAQLLAESQNHIARNEMIFAEVALKEAIAVAPYLPEIRRELHGLRARRAAEDDVEADRLLAQGDLEAGLAALERAQEAAPSRERAAKMVRAHTAMEFAAGMTAYQEKRYREAIFQFKKALARDPDHAEAKRYLGFAQRFEQDTTTDTLTDRFSKLE